MALRNPIETRRKFVEAWNNTMIKIWVEAIDDYHIVDKGNLLHSPIALDLKPDGRITSIRFEHKFLEYGIWQDYGVGRELEHGNYEHNVDYIESNGRKRERRPWFSVKYYSSIMRLRDFMAQSLGDEFKAMFCEALDDKLRKRNTKYYRDKGLV